MAIKNRMNITVYDAKNWLRIDHNHDDVLIDNILDGALDFVDSYLNNDFLDADGYELPIPSEIRIAVLQLVAVWYENRTDTIQSYSGQFNIRRGMSQTFGIKDILNKYRLEPGF